MLRIPLLWQYVLLEIEQVSSQTLKDYISLVASWHHDVINAKQYGCEKQVEKYKRGPSSEVRIVQLRSRNGCASVAPKPRRTVGEINFHNCFCDHLCNNFGHLMWLHKRFEEGIMPFEGSLMDQPNKVIEIFKVLEGFKFEREMEIQREHERQSKR